MIGTACSLEDACQQAQVLIPCALLNNKLHDISVIIFIVYFYAYKTCNIEVYIYLSHKF